ncbi:hypothetical protein AAC387_Pa04g0586 [Persea americana]
MDGIKNCFKERESSYSICVIRLSNVVINAYVRQGMIKEAESLLESINFWTMDIFVDFYMRNHQMGIAVKCMEAAVTKMTKNELHPCQVRVGAFLKYFMEEKDVEHFEDLCKIEPQISQRIRENNVQMTSEMEKFLERVCP